MVFSCGARANQENWVSLRKSPWVDGFLSDVNYVMQLAKRGLQLLRAFHAFYCHFFQCVNFNLKHHKYPFASFLQPPIIAIPYSWLINCLGRYCHNNIRPLHVSFLLFFFGFKLWYLTPFIFFFSVSFEL